MGGRKLVGTAVAGLSVLAIGFGWGYQAHRLRAFPYSVVSFFLSDREPQPYSWIRPTSRPLEDLRSLPYVSSMFDPDSDRRGVQVHDTERAHSGLNFYFSGFTEPFLLIDMEGREVYRWAGVDGLVAHAEPLPGGDLLVVRFDRSVSRLDRQGIVRWEVETRAHHDVWVRDDELWTLTRRERLVPEVHALQPTLEDTVTVLSLADGAVRDEFSLLDIVRDSPYAFLIPDANLRSFNPEDGPLDILHTNHVEVFDGSLAAVSPLFSRGNVLISMRHLNAIMVLDGATREIAWLWGPSNLWGQHQPTLLDTGRLLLFDNGLVHSRVLELDPTSSRVEWSWTRDGFYSGLRGSVQRLDNGNTLITESDAGHVYEVTPEGTVVWEFANPDVSADGRRGVIWRMIRLSAGQLPFLD